ncbi:MAG: adenosylcobalamin-dependent ribonucleoside-diphosphate reductase [Gammaproteobacteria bacterium]
MDVTDGITDDAGIGTDISRRIWAEKYRQADEPDIRASWRRVAAALAAVEGADAKVWETRFRDLLDGFAFLPGGRILAGAGTGRRVTLFNCFVMGTIEDSLDGIFDALKEGALTMQQGGGVGYDFSTLRPFGMPAQAVGGVASGPVSFMRIWDSMCDTLLSTGARRGAMMATLRCDHPDIERFIDAKRERRELRNFNLSVLVTDAFIDAVRADADWPLVFPRPAGAPAGGATLMRTWSGRQGAMPCAVVRTVRARALWERLMRATYDVAEPGVLFIDRINAENNLYYREHISATNPCGEIPLPPYGACDLGSLNLTHFVRDPFGADARLDLDALAAAVPLAVRLLDNVIDASRFPLPRQAEQARGTRRIGLGITGLADALILLNLRYDAEVARALAGEVMATLCHSAYRASIALAREKGAFPYFEAGAYLNGAFVARLPEDIRAGIARHGIRNSHLLAIAPTGTISLLANNISSGLEPVYEFEYRRRVRHADGGFREHRLSDHALLRWRALRGDAPLPSSFVTAVELPPAAHLAMQAAVQPHVDSAISKTINIPEAYPFAAFVDVYQQAYDLGLKGCTTFRPNRVTGAVLREADAAAGNGPCCTLEREPD